ncbi:MULTISPECIES: hypothetical protein [unclassified Nitrobacter]|uniref:hypothetical protein n=1 Tax=unclassified Nitrobacter TaxID=2620411 RepID=UPI000A8B582C|nr:MULTISPECIES: hypothetical protein [unclassified Nitrobacter]
MGTQRPKTLESEHIVLQFRPRRAAGAPDRPPPNSARDDSPAPSPRNHLPRNQQPPEQPDDFRHRMLANAAAVAFTIALTAVGLWLAMSIADLRMIGTAP